MDHLTAIEDLREGINLRGYGQLDPLVEYKNEAYSMFEKLIADINFEVTRRLFKIEINVGANLDSPVHNHQEERMILQSASAIDPFKANNQQPDFAKASSVEPKTNLHKKLGEKRSLLVWIGKEIQEMPLS